jgi:hypothetical protein
VICRFCFKDSHEIKNRKCWHCWKKSDQNKAIAAMDEAKMKNPTALHFSNIYMFHAASTVLSPLEDRQYLKVP